MRRHKGNWFMLSVSAAGAMLCLVAAHRGLALEADAMPGMPVDHLLFATSSHCMSCHSQVHAPGGEDISIGTQWRASVMANSSRDPYWQASIVRETMDHPMASAAIQDKCSTCHMPMQRTQARAEGLKGEVLKYLAGISNGSAMEEPQGELDRAPDPKATLAADGVSCTICHQIKADNLHDRSSLDGGYLVDTFRRPEERVIYGPFDDPDEGRKRLMNSATSYVPARGDHIKDSALCASCHTLLTDALDDKGNPAGSLPEQMPYQEWQHSVYADGAGEAKSCQSCHMTQVQGQAPITSIHAQLHDGVMRHIFVGGNAFLLDMLKDHGGELGVAAPAPELDASARRSEALLGQQTASLAISGLRRENGRLSFDVHVTSRTGHKFPTGYPARRAWLHVTVRDSNGRVFFESGAVRPDGSIAGNDNDADPLKFEPHYSRITDPGQVQIYESIMGDYRGRVTTGLLWATHYLKDNRILPKGFDKATAGAEIEVVGEAKSDPAFTGGADTVRYDVALAGMEGAARVGVELMYESIGYRWAHNLEAYDAREPRRFLGYYNQQASSAAKNVASSSATLP
jgi:hypothetical protein